MLLIKLYTLCVKQIFNLLSRSCFNSQLARANSCIKYTTTVNPNKDSILIQLFSLEALAITLFTGKNGTQPWHQSVQTTSGFLIVKII